MDPNETVSMNDFLSAFGVAPTDGGQPPAGEPNEPTPPADAPPPADTPPPADNPPVDTPPADEPPAQPPVDKTAAAFAQMRIENKQYQTLLQEIAGILGVQDTKDPAAVSAALQQKIVETQAKQSNVPAEMLMRLKTLEARDQEYMSNQLKTTAYMGFQKVKDTFGLNDQELGQFAEQLASAGRNPFEQEVDVLREYQVMNFDKLLQNAEARGIQKEAERASKAATHGTNPDNKQGQGEGSTEKITSVAQLEGWLAKQS